MDELALDLTLVCWPLVYAILAIVGLCSKAIDSLYYLAAHLGTSNRFGWRVRQTDSLTRFNCLWGGENILCARRRTWPHIRSVPIGVIDA